MDHQFNVSVQVRGFDFTGRIHAVENHLIKGGNVGIKRVADILPPQDRGTNTCISGASSNSGVTRSAISAQTRPFSEPVDSSQLQRENGARGHDKAKECVNDARAIIVDAAQAAASRTSSVHLRCLVDLKLRQFLLRPVLQVLAFVQREPEILKSSLVANDACDLLPLLFAVGANQFHPDVHFQVCQSRSALLPKKA